MNFSEEDWVLMSLTKVSLFLMSYALCKPQALSLMLNVAKMMMKMI